jgi:hypothetical protein
VLDIVFEFDQWFIPCICHAIGNPVNVTSCVSTAESQTACHEAQDTSHPKSCHITGHLCCLGFTTLASQTTHVALRLNHMWNPVFQTLLLQEHPSKQFKPPKRLIQI